MKSIIINDVIPFIKDSLKKTITIAKANPKNILVCSFLVGLCGLIV